MHLTTTSLSMFLLASLAPAQLLLPGLLQDLRGADFQPPNRLAYRGAEQAPLGGATGPAPAYGSAPGSGSADLPAFKAEQFTKIPQDETTCATYGEQQWAGTIDVTDERRLFYWFFDSRNDPENDPVIIWVNGGPGASSMEGLFAELGPCTIKPNQTVTTPNPFAWNNNASLLFIDQPAGVGFSDVKPGTPYPSNDRESARDLQAFLRLFFRDVFPSKASLPIHFAGESYGGHYVPSTVQYVLESRAYKSEDAFWGNITSIILVNALLDRLQMTIGHYELYCTDYRGHIWNETACQGVTAALPDLEHLRDLCNLGYGGHECVTVALFSNEASVGLVFEDSLAGKRSIYNIQRPCLNQPFCFPEESKGNFTAFLNKPAIIKALGFPSDYIYEDFGWAVAMAFLYDGGLLAPTIRQVSSILDAKSPSPQYAQEPIRLLVLNGNEDALCNTPGQKWVYERLPWSGAAGYRAAKWRPWGELGLGVGTGEWKTSEGAQLVFLALDGAGHMVPGDQPEVAEKVIQKWISGWET